MWDTMPGLIPGHNSDTRLPQTSTAAVAALDKVPFVVHTSSQGEDYPHYTPSAAVDQLNMPLSAPLVTQDDDTMDGEQ